MLEIKFERVRRITGHVQILFSAQPADVVARIIFSRRRNMLKIMLTIFRSWSNITMSLVRPKVGDVFELPVNNGLAYFQILSVVEFCNCFYIRVSKGVFSERPDDINRVLLKKEQFSAITYRSIKSSSVKAEFVGNYPIPENVNCKPKYFKSTGPYFIDTTRPPFWSLWTFTIKGNTIYLGRFLPKEYWDCPEVSICPLNDIVGRINEKWTVYKNIWPEKKILAWEKKEAKAKEKEENEKGKEKQEKKPKCGQRKTKSKK